MRGNNSKGMIRRSVLALTVLLLVFGPTLATKPGRNVNPNGFPSGEHYNLNIIGKKPNFTCPEPELDAFGNPIYGNVIFVPENGAGIRIFMQSGKKGKRKNGEVITGLQVIDPCTAAFDGDEAIMQLQANEFGYDVYARALAKPTDNPYMDVFPDLFAVEDEVGGTLIWLGIVYKDGVFTKTSETFTRQKGKSTAIEITDLFMWAGMICWDVECDSCTATAFCQDISTGEYFPKEEALCPVGSTEVTLFCRTYEVPTWVFNIADFVTYLWEVNNNGLKLLQLRFYPRTE